MQQLPLHNKEMTTITQTRSSKRILLYLSIFLGISWTAYAFYTQTIAIPSVDFLFRENDKPEQEYGLNILPDFKDVIQIMDLPANYLPETGKHRNSGRLIVVGDVHGMKEPLEHLLAKVDFDQKHDHLILAGDMISKGPDSPGVVDLAMKLGATGVRGNHEDRILLAHRDMLAQHMRLDLPGPMESGEKAQDLMEEESFNRGDYKDRKLVKALGEHRIKWLKKCPVILRVGKLGNMGEVVVVHAGLAPGVNLEKQDPSLVMNMRTIGKHGIPSDSRKGTTWRKPWNQYQKSLPHHSRTTVIYGHDAHKGLQIKKYSMGIDTGCQKGGKLTAVVIEGGHSDHKSSIVQVDCKHKK